MGRRNFSRNVRPMGLTILLWGIILLIVLDVLSKFGLVDFTTFNSSILTLIAGFFLLAEVGVFGKGGRKKDVLSMFIMFVAVLAIIGAILGLLGVTVVFFETIAGLVGIALLIFVVVEIFRR